MPITLYLGRTEIDPSGVDEGQTGVGVDFSGRVGERTDVSFAFVNGPADIVSTLAFSGMYRPVFRAVAKNPRWSAVAGDFSSARHVLAGPVVRGDGVTFSSKGRVIADITAARPTYFGGGAAGHLVQGRLGGRIPGGTVAVLGSDLARPPASSRVFGGINLVEPQSAAEVEEINELRRLLSRESRVRGWGFEADLARGASQSLLVRAGTMEIVNLGGIRSSGPAGEARYSFRNPRLLVSAYASHSPPSVPGTYVGSGDSTSVLTQVSVGRSWKITADGSTSSFSTVGQPGLRYEAASAGLKRDTSSTRLIVRGTYRELHSLLPSVTRSVTAGFTNLQGVVTVDAQAEVGRIERAGALRPLRELRTRLTIGGDGNSVWAMASYSENSFQSIRTRGDIGGSFAIKRAEFEAGAGYGTGQLLGNMANAWATAEVPLPAQMTLVTGIDYMRWNYNASPYVRFLLLDEPSSPWRFTIGVRQRLAVKMPFIQRAGTPASPVVRSPGADVRR